MKRHKYNYTPGPSDLCQTPRYALEPLMELTFLKNITWAWECASGECNLALALAENNVTPLMTDINGDYAEQCDFLHDEPPFPSLYYDAIITNPPYSMKKEFTTRCYELGVPWALLMPADTISNKWFIELANKYNPKPGIIWFSPRVDFKMPNKGWKGKGAHYSVAWFTWKMGFEGNIYKRMGRWTKEYKESNR